MNKEDRKTSVSEEDKTAGQIELTEEQIQERVEAMRSAVAAFTADPQHERFKLCVENKNAIEGYVQERNLEWTEQSLRTAFTNLSEAGKLVLYEESKLQVPVAPKEQTADEKLPPIEVASAEDLGIGFAARQQAHKQVDGVAPASNREAFARAAQRAANQKVAGRRFHL
jgi:hypothetical protein